MVGWVISSEDILKVVEGIEEVEASDDDVVKFRKGEEKCGRSLDFLLTSSCALYLYLYLCPCLYPLLSPRLQLKFKLLILHLPITIGGDGIQAGKKFDTTRPSPATETGDGGTIALILGIDLGGDQVMYLVWVP